MKEQIAAQFIFREQQCTVFQSALYQTNTVLLDRRGYAVLVDPNWLPGEIAYIKAAWQKQCGDKPLYVVLTHSDFDHIIGVGAFPEAQFVASQALAERADQAAEIEEIQTFDDRHYIQRDYPIVYPRIDLMVGDAQSHFKLADDAWEAWPAPGHHQDAIILWDTTRRLLIAGDYLSDIEFPFVYHSFSAYHRTLDRLEAIIRERQPQLLLPGHGTPTTDPGEMLQRVDESRQYLNDIKTAQEQQTEFPLEKWLSAYPFPRGLAKEHAKNMARWGKIN